MIILVQLGKFRKVQFRCFWTDLNKKKFFDLEIRWRFQIWYRTFPKWLSGPQKSNFLFYGLIWIGNWMGIPNTIFWTSFFMNVVIIVFHAKGLWKKELLSREIVGYYCFDIESWTQESCYLVIISSIMYYWWKHADSWQVSKWFSLWTWTLKLKTNINRLWIIQVEVIRLSLTNAKYLCTLYIH